jgi:nitrite reductase (NO-forming)
MALMNNIFSIGVFHRSKMIILIGIIGMSLLALNHSNIQNYKVIATLTSTETASITTNQPRSNTSSSITSESNTKEFTLIAKEATLDISPSKKIKAWTYNGSIPGPTLRVTEGDKVIVHFINKLDLPHTIHFHGGHNGTMDGVFEIVPPNKTFTYEFTAAPSGALMYHCHVMPVVEHVRMGLYGAFIIDPKTPTRLEMKIMFN